MKTYYEFKVVFSKAELKQLKFLYEISNKEKSFDDFVRDFVVDNYRG